MKVLSLPRLYFIGALMIGLFIAWHAAVAQKANVGTTGGTCYTCQAQPCDWHAVDCNDLPNKKCGKSDSCCRGGAGGDGDCSGIGGEQCLYTGCKHRRDEVCTDWP